MKRFEFICKGKRSHFLEALTEEAARSMFAEARISSSLEIIDVIEVQIPAPYNPSAAAMKIEGFERVDSEPKPTAQEIAALAASSEKVGY